MCIIASINCAKSKAKFITNITFILNKCLVCADKMRW